MKEEITQYNVEAWLLDWHEKKLSEQQSEQLMAFIQLHPDLELDPSDFMDLRLNPVEMAHPDKSELYRTEFSIPDLSEDEIRQVAYLEGDLYLSEQKAFTEELASNEQFAAQFELLRKTQLHPDEKLVFSDKNKLHKKTRRIPLYVLSSLASAAMLILAWILLTPDQLADENKAVLSEETKREIIFLNKLIHPSTYEQIALDKPGRALAPSTIEVEDREFVSDEPEIILAYNPYRVQPLSMDEADPKLRSINYFSLPQDSENQEEYKTLLALSGDMIRKNILGQDPELVASTRFTFWELADVGLEKVAGFLSLPYDIDREYDQQGELVEVSFESPLLAFSTPLNSRKGQ